MINSNESWANSLLQGVTWLELNQGFSSGATPIVQWRCSHLEIVFQELSYSGLNTQYFRGIIADPVAIGNSSGADAAIANNQATLKT